MKLSFKDLKLTISIFCFISISATLSNCGGNQDYNNNYLRPGSASYSNPYDIPNAPYPDQDQYYQPPSTIENSDQPSIWDYK